MRHSVAARKWARWIWLSCLVAVPASGLTAGSVAAQMARPKPARPDSIRAALVADSVRAALVADSVRAALAADSVRAALAAVMLDSARAADSLRAAYMAWQADSARAVLAALAGYAAWSGSSVVLENSIEALARGAFRAPGFSEQQLAYRRVLEARLEKRDQLKALFEARGLPYPAAELFVRIFKRERLLEVWARPAEHDRFTLLKTYPICALASQFGPKRAQGDGQTPEGVYAIDGFNPSSDFFLSLHLDYPNKSDRILSPGEALGGDIYIHGGCRTEGCLAVTDDAIKELYWLAVEARNAGQQRIPVHIFPTRMTDSELNRMTRIFDPREQLRGFWANLRPLYDYFETHRRLPLVTIDDFGRYRLMPQLGQPAGK